MTCGSLIGCGSLQVISVVANTSFSTCREVFIVGMDVFVYREFCGNYCKKDTTVTKQLAFSLCHSILQMANAETRSCHVCFDLSCVCS